MTDNMNRQIDRTSVTYEFLERISDYANRTIPNILGTGEAEEAYLELRAFLRKKEPTLIDSELVERINENFESVVTIMLSKYSCKRLMGLLEKTPKISILREID